MKQDKFKALLKESLREVIQEELREILLEAVKAPKQVIEQSIAPTPVMESQTPGMSAEEKRNAYANILGETAGGFSNNAPIQQFSAPSGFDSTNGTLPSGEVGMDQIMGLMKK
jgi:hypothetical protein